MQRFCRALRVGARVFKDNEVPAVAGEEVRRNQSQEDKFNPQRKFQECFGFSTGLVISWDLYHRYRRKSLLEVQEENSSSREGVKGTQTQCPFSLKNAIAQAQPIFSSVTSSSVNYINPPRANQNTVVKKGSSIDTSPFLKESLIFDFESGKSASFSDDEDSFVFEEVPEKKTSPLKPKDPKVADMAERLAGNLLSAVGATQLLLGDRGKTSGTEPPMNGLELLKKGSELGSSRALYNLGVYYDRQRDFELARDYYKRAADIGHPIASYNYAAMILEKDPRMTPEVKLLMSYAYEHGVPEAKAYAT